MNNIPLIERREEFGIETVLEPSKTGEAEIVVGTKDVSRQDYDDGIRIIYAVYSLYSFRTLRCLGHYLHTSKKMSYGELFTAFVKFCKKNKIDCS